MSAGERAENNLLRNIQVCKSKMINQYYFNFYLFNSFFDYKMNYV